MNLERTISIFLFLFSIKRQLKKLALKFPNLVSILKEQVPLFIIGKVGKLFHRLTLKNFGHLEVHNSSKGSHEVFCFDWDIVSAT